MLDPLYKSESKIPDNDGQNCFTAVLIPKEPLVCTDLAMCLMGDTVGDNVDSSAFFQ